MWIACAIGKSVVSPMVGYPTDYRPLDGHHPADREDRP